MKLSYPGQTAIVFDFGGVLMDWDPRYLYSKVFDGDQEAMERFLEEIDFYAWNVVQDEGRSFAEGVAELSARFPQYADLIQAYDTRWEESLAGPIQPNIDTLRQLKEAGQHLFGLSNWSAEKFQVAHHKYRFFDWFEDIIISGEVRLIKPDPRIYDLLEEHIDRPRGNCLVIDDSLTNTAAAQEFGFQGILYQSPEQLREVLAPYLAEPSPGLKSWADN